MSEPLHILIVDDDDVIRTLLIRFLEKEHTLFCARNGAEALDILQAHQAEIDLVLCDIEMPQVNGLEVLKTVRSQYPGIDIIMISGSANTRVAVQAIREGAYDYISKPFHDIEEVSFTIQRWKKQQSLESKLSEYASLYREMMKNMKIRTFLAVDVSGSTSIKNGEDPFIVHYSFKAYQEFIESTVKAFGGTIHNTSGDGAMACFEQADDAVGAAQQILADIGAFNSQKNQLDHEFKLRIGLHTGEVLINSDGIVSEMFAESLDIAGHLQKSADENGVLASDAAVVAVSDPAIFEPAGLKVDGLATFRLGSLATKEARSQR